MSRWLALGAALAVAALVAVYEIRLATVRGLLDAERASHAQDRAAWAEASAKAEADNRETERLRRRALDGVIDAARQENLALQSAAAGLAGDSDRLRRTADAAAASTCGAPGDPAAAAGSAPAAGPGLVWRELYVDAEEEATSLGPAYDAARAAGLACERLYDAMRSR